MDNKTMSKLIYLASDERLCGKKSDKLIDKSIDVVCNLRECDERSLKRFFLVPQATVTAIRAFNASNKEIKTRRKIISKVLDMPEELITGDLTTFISGEKKQKVFVDDLRYDASVSDSRLANLQAVWGDLDLRPLHDFKNMQNLKVVMGNLETSSAENQDGLRNLEVVTGDLVLDNVDLENLENLSYVGGNIYNKGNILTMDDLKSNTKQNVK